MALVKDLARRAAEEALETYWDRTFPVDPVKIARQLGMEVWVADLPDAESGRIVKKDGSPAEIYLARDEPYGRQNFTCAHELGHWFEREEQDDQEYSFVDHRTDGYDKNRSAHEWFADWFAANLLMPAREFIEAVDEGLLLRDLAQRFGVTMPSVRTRARNLGVEIAS